MGGWASERVRRWMGGWVGVAVCPGFSTRRMRLQRWRFQKDGAITVDALLYRLESPRSSLLAPSILAKLGTHDAP